MRRYGRQNLLNISLGSLAVSLSVCCLYFYSSHPTIVVASVFFALICTTDSLYGKIPNLLNGALVLVGFSASTYASGMSGFVHSLAGMALGIALLLLPFLMGGFGAGDVKALGALGALIGPHDLLHVFVYMAFYGGALALLYNIFSSDLKQKFYEGCCSVRASARSERPAKLAPDGHHSKRQLVRFPYATAIAFGYYTFVIRGGVL